MMLSTSNEYEREHAYKNLVNICIMQLNIRRWKIDEIYRARGGAGIRRVCVCGGPIISLHNRILTQ